MNDGITLQRNAVTVFIQFDLKRVQKWAGLTSAHLLDTKTTAVLLFICIRRNTLSSEITQVHGKQVEGGKCLRRDGQPDRITSLNRCMSRYVYVDSVNVNVLC